MINFFAVCFVKIFPQVKNFIYHVKQFLLFYMPGTQSTRERMIATM